MKNLKFITFVNAFIIALFFVGCGSDTAQNEKIIKVGLINPATGELSSYAEGVKRGIDLAVEEVNSNKLLGDKSINIIFADSKGESKTALTALQKMISVDGIKYIIGDISSTVTLSMQPITEKNKVFLFSPGAATPKLTNAGAFFARNWPSSVEEANSAAEYSFNNLSYKSAIIVYVNNDWGLGLTETFEKRFSEIGGHITTKEIYPYENVDFRTLILKIKNQKSDCIYLAGNQKEMGHFMKQLRENNIQTPVVSNTSFLEKDCLNTAGIASEGVVVPTPAYNSNDSLSSIKKFTQNMQKKYKSAPTIVEVNGYDVVMLIVEAINKVGSDPVDVANYIRNLKNYNGAGGVVNFVNGDVSIKNEYKKIIGGNPRVIK
jgi:branched-chain amino acid transport system substrate-binding protein